MNNDPTFATRAELTSWMERQLTGANALPAVDQMSILTLIRRVTTAHMHLPFKEGKP